MKNLMLALFVLISATGCRIADSDDDACRTSRCSDDCVDDGFDDGHCNDDHCVCTTEGGDGDVDGDTDGDGDGDCVPDCAGLECDDDGCGGSCGSCSDEEFCSWGVCIDTCTPSCVGLECGDDGCGGSCGTCDSDDTCVAGGCYETGCAQHSDCDNTDICVASDCVPAYGHDYQITIAWAAGLPETSSSGDAWDWPGGLPDPFINFFVVGGDSWSTFTANDTLDPVWNVTVVVRVNASTKIRWEMWDEDVAASDPMVGYWSDEDAFAISTQIIRDGGWINEGLGTTMQFYIDPL